jgi:predicted NAD-dependent protein-ADP-ribosyltransferase YbiA (DUF1768 family)
MSFKDLKTGLELNRPDTEFQYNAFEYFLQVVDETSKFNTLKKGMSVDTKGKKNLAEILDYESTWDAIKQQKIISTLDINNILNNSVLTPFFKVHDLYRKWYGGYYFLDNLEPFQTLVTRLQDKFLPYLKGGQEARVKFLNTLQNDFLLFLIQNYNDDFSRSSFEKMFGFVENEKSVADMVQEYRKSNPDDYAIKIIYPQKSAQIDPSTDKLTDIVRIFERALSTTDNNDFIDAMHDLRDNNEELYKKLVQISLNQAGFNNSPFTLNKVLPTFKNVVRNKNNEIESSENDYLRQLQLNAIDRFSRLREDDQTRLIDSFEDMFYRNNPQFLSNQINAFSYAPYFYVYDNEKQRRIIKDGNYSEVEQLGDFYKKSYFLESGMPTRNMVLNTPNTDLPFDSDPFGFEDEVIPQQRFQGYKGGFENTGKGTPEGDGADKAMREVADGFIGEIVNKKSSSYTSAQSIGKKTKQGVTPEEGSYTINAGNIEKGSVIMLARNGKFNNRPLEESTKRDIADANMYGAEFIVGDMPGVDSQFIDYLQEIGAKFTIYHTGNTPRIQVNQPTTETINIYAGTGENAELSNFAKRPFSIGNQTFNTVEGAFQSAKLAFTDHYLATGTLRKGDQEIINELRVVSGAEAKKIGRKIEGLISSEWDRVSLNRMKSFIKLSFEQNPDALAKLLATGNATLTHTQDKGKWGTEFPRLLMEVRDELRGTQLTTQLFTNVKPIIDLSKEWKNDLESRPVYSSEGVNTMRTNAAKPNEHFGNPFSASGYSNTIKVSSIGAAVRMYKDWLLNGAVSESEIVTGSINDLEKFDEQRLWILDQINQGKLDNATLLYAGKSEARGQGTHAEALLEVIEKLRSNTTITDITFSTDELTQANDLVDQCKIGGSSSKTKTNKSSESIKPVTLKTQNLKINPIKND